MMMNRRAFLTVSGLAGLTPLASISAAGADEPKAARDFYELRRYLFDTPEQRKGFDTFMSEAAIPALNRLGIKPVGVFYSEKETSSVYVLLRAKTLDALATATQRLLADTEFQTKGAALLDAPADAPAFKRMESSLMVSFTGMPELETPAKGPDRVFQLRTYESPSVKTGQKKIEMFNVAEITIFRKVGLNPVFFGETLVGAKMPNLTYMLGFDDMAAMGNGWKNFGGNPDWRKLSTKPEYADKTILLKGGITNIVLKPAEYSQI
jgi:hypothetical protein